MAEAVVNYIALLGWSPEDNQEIFSLDELIKVFDYHHISKSPAVFDIVKLKWMNGEYIKARENEKFYEMAMPYIKEVITKPLDLKKILMVAQLTIFCGLLFFSIVFLRQIDYLQNKPLGYNNRNTISFGWLNPYEITSLKEELSQHPDVLAVSCGALLPIGNWAHRDIHLVEHTILLALV